MMLTTPVTSKIKALAVSPFVFYIIIGVPLVLQQAVTLICGNSHALQLSPVSVAYGMLAISILGFSVFYWASPTAS